jgi:hypothetical protein
MYKHNSVGNASKLRIKNVNECVTASTKLYLLGGFGNVLYLTKAMCSICEVAGNIIFVICCSVARY